MLKSFYRRRRQTIRSGLSGNKSLETILAEERDFVQKIPSKPVKLDQPSPWRWLMTLFLSLFALIKIVTRLRQWWRIGRDNPLPEVNLAGTLHEPPSDLPPALVEALMQPDLQATGKAITATILELCRRKILALQVISKPAVLGLFKQEELELQWVKSELPISTLEKRLLNLLFGYGEKSGPITLSDIKQLGQKKDQLPENFGYGGKKRRLMIWLLKVI